MNRELSMPLAESWIDAYRRDGVVCLRGVFDADWVALIREGIERNLREPGEFANFYDRDADGHVFLNDVVSWRRIEEYRRYIFESPAGAIAARLMGSSKVNIFYDSAFYRTAGTTTPTPWHQDVPYWCIEGNDVCSLWAPVDSVAKDSALEFVAGSHRWDSVFYRESFFAEGGGTHSFEAARDTRTGDEKARATAPDIEARRADHDILSWDMEPGDCLAFTGMVFHGALGNQAEGRPLRALATRWAGDDARFAIKPEGSDPDLRGRGLDHGDPFGGEQFPVVWPRATRP
jgi:ectoine hydroxylase-related dioxygenase (phytanoyl-CoA dioxygenase family)